MRFRGNTVMQNGNHEPKNHSLDLWNVVHCANRWAADARVFPPDALRSHATKKKNRKQSLDQKGDSYLVIGFGLALPPPNSVMWWPCNVLWGSEIELSSHSPGKSHSRLTRKARWICPSHVTYDAVKIEKNWHYLLVGETRWITAHSACSYTMGCFSLRGWNTLAIRDGPRQRPWTLSVWYIGSLQISIGAQHEADVSALKIWSSRRHSLCLAPSPTKKLAHTQRQPASSRHDWAAGCGHRRPRAGGWPLAWLLEFLWEDSPPTE